MATSSATVQTVSKLKRYVTSSLGAATIASLVLLPSLSSAENDWSYSKEPLFWSQGVKPNVALMIDDSISMTAIVAEKNYTENRKSSTKWKWCSDSNATSGTSAPTCSSKGDAIENFTVLAWDGNTVTESHRITTNWRGTNNNCSVSNNESGFANNSGSNDTNANIVVTKICQRSTTFKNGDAITFKSHPSGTTTSLEVNKTYYVVNKETNGFQLATTKGGTATTFTVNFKKTTGDWVFEGIKLPMYISGKTVALCNVDTGKYIGNSGGMAISGATLPDKDKLGVLVTLDTANDWSRDSCVRWKMASTARSTDLNSPAGYDYSSYDNSNTGTTGTAYSALGDNAALREYGYHLLNSYLPAGKGTLNMDTDNDIPGVNRMQAAREAAQQVIAEYYKRMNIGLYSFATIPTKSVDRWGNETTTYERGGEVDYAVPRYGTTPEIIRKDLIGDLLNMDAASLPAHAQDGKVGELRAVERTPLAKTMKVLVDDFKKPYADGGPIAYRCQKNYAIVMTDGEPSDDSGKLDDLAQDAYGDLRTSGDDNDGKPFQPTEPAAPWKVQNLVTYTLGFGIENNLLKRTPLVDEHEVNYSDLTVDGYLKLDGHGLKTGDYVQVVSGANGNLIDGNYYYAVVKDASYFKLAGEMKCTKAISNSNTNCSTYSSGDGSSDTVNNSDAVDQCKAGVTVAKSSVPKKDNTKKGCIDLTGKTGTLKLSIGPGKSFFSFTPEQLAADLSQVFREADNITSSASAVSANSKQVGGDTLVYQAKFTTKDWSGTVTAYPVSVSGGGKAEVNTNIDPTTKGWTTKQTLKSVNQRSSKIYTWSKQAVVNGSVTKQRGPMAFTATDSTYTNLAADQQVALGVDKNEAINTIKWLLGEEVAGFRTRTSENGLLGDVINADPEYLGALNFGYEALPSSAANCSGTSCTGKEQYVAYVKDRKENRTSVLFVGTNHGFVHALNAQTGEEMAAYVPAGVYTDWQDSNDNGARDTTETFIHKFRALRNYPYNHEFMVDGSATVGDAFTGNAWKTYLVGGLGAGGRSVYALDVTDQANFSSATSLVKWELIDPDLGYSYGKPIIARMKDGKWYAIFPNGLDSNEDKARVFIVDIESGAVIKKLVGNDTDGPNGMMTVQVRLDATRTVVDIYAGDIRGNIWRFDVSSESPSSWSTDGSRVFQAKDSSGNVQSITGGIRLGAHPGGLGTIVYFGSGKYFEINDNAYSSSTTFPKDDAFYAVLDSRQGNTVDKSALVQQVLTADGNIRTMDSPKDVEWQKGAKGWYIQLPDTGERVISTPVIFGGRVIFTSIVPSGEGSCEGSGYGWLNEVDALTGKQFDKPVLDANNDGRISSNEQLASSVKVTGGLPSDPSILGGGEHDYKMMGTTSQTNSIQFISETQVDTEGLKGGSGRMSWQQLQ